MNESRPVPLPVHSKDLLPTADYFRGACIPTGCEEMLTDSQSIYTRQGSAISEQGMFDVRPTPNDANSSLYRCVPCSFVYELYKFGKLVCFAGFCQSFLFWHCGTYKHQFHKIHTANAVFVQY